MECEYKESEFETCANFDKLCTRKEKTIDFKKEFTLDTPWMVMSHASDNCIFAIALSYNPEDPDGFFFNTFYDREDSITATSIISWGFARHLTKEEEILYLGVK